MGMPLPLIAMRAFSEVGRTGSVKAAAAALGVTPGAVSQQVRSLEAWLGIALFERRNRRLLLTETGTHLHAASGRSLVALEDGAKSFRRSMQFDRLAVSA